MAPMSANGSTAGKKRAYGNACLACRQKKRSCDGRRPRCGNCENSDEVCTIPAPLRPLRKSTAAEQTGDITALEENINRLNEHVARLEERLSYVEGGLRTANGSYDSAEEEGRASDPVWDRANQLDVEERPAETVVSIAEVSSTDAGGAKYKLTLDDAGNITYHGVTGWDAGQDVPPTPAGVPSNPDFASPPFPLQHLGDLSAHNLALAPIFQALSASKHISVAPELGDALLNAFYSYQVFNVTHRATFLRDMVLGGPGFSEFLLMILYAMASRMIDGLTEEQKIAQGDMFVKLSKAYLIKEMEGPSKITTIQGLLLLSARECAFGETSQGWNHAGLAFRMIQDLGIHHAPELVSGVSRLSLDEQVAREGLYWSAFIWDTILSLALGREPTVAPRPGGNPMTLPDFDDDLESWTPYFTNPLNCPPALHNYVYQPARRSTTFRLLARLCRIVHDVIIHLYSHETRDNDKHARDHFVSKSRQHLVRLWEDSPDDIKRHPSGPSPPPWLFEYLMLYHATYILLFRPTVTEADIANASGPAQACLAHSAIVSQLAVNFSQTFDERFATTARYSWFVAARFDIVLLDSLVLQAQQEALDRLSFWLKVMGKNILRAPSIRRSVKQITALICENLDKNHLLASTESGMWIRNYHSQQTGIRFTPTTQPTFLADDAFNFFDLLQPV